MALQVWLPLDGDLKNQGLMDLTVTNSGATVDNNGKIGKCYDFSGGSAKALTVSPPPLTNSTTDWTYACWMKVNTMHTGTLLSGRTAVNTLGITILFVSGGFYLDDGVRWSVTPSTQFIATDKWYHICFVRKGGVGKYLYINGVLEGSTTTAGTPTEVNPTNFAIGRSHGAETNLSGNQLNGYLNDVRLYDHALSPREIHEIAKGMVLHFPLSRPAENLLLDTNQGKTHWSWSGNGGTRTVVDDGMGVKMTSMAAANDGSWSVLSYSDSNIQKILEANTDYTISFDVKPNVTFSFAGIGLRRSNGADEIFTAYSCDIPCQANRWTHVEVQRKTKSTLPTISSQLIYMAGFPLDVGNEICFKNIKVEKGTIATPWCPNPSDALYSAMGFNDNIKYDVSGYCRNGTANNITWSGDTPRYSASAVFNGTDSYVKVPKGNWMMNGMSELTVSIWVWVEDWSALTNTRFFSCTESGGWNVEPGGTGKLRFPINVWTDAEKTTHAYINNGAGTNVAGFVISDLSTGWHMFTAVYTTSGIKTYIDGVLKDNRAYTSYGIYYSSANLAIGAESAGANSVTSPYFEGKISDFRLYNTALSDADILDLYQTPISLSQNGTFLVHEMVE